MSNRILFVDDEPNVLTAYEREFRNDFELDTASGGREGLNAIAENEPYAVVVSDYQMPGMNGIEFLARVSECAPDSVRVMLTGHANLNVTIASVNKGNIFRFLTKPARRDELVHALKASLRQHQLILAERELTEKTLRGSIKVLTEILSLVHPLAFGKASRLKRYVAHIATKLDLPDVWQFEVAAMLSQIGCITLAPDTLHKVYVGEELSPDEDAIFSSHPKVAGELLARIPRLEPIAEMIARQQQIPTNEASAAAFAGNDTSTLGAHILSVVLRFDTLTSAGVSRSHAIKELRREIGAELFPVIDALESMPTIPSGLRPRSTRTGEMKNGMVLDQDVKTVTGIMLVPKGQEITTPVMRRLMSFANTVGVVEPISVLAPADMA